jgi:hypothetical protein
MQNGWATGSNELPPLSEFIVTEKVYIKPELRKVNFYEWEGWDALVYDVDTAAKRYLVQRARPIDVEVVLDRDMVADGWEIVWEAR